MGMWRRFKDRFWYDDPAWYNPITGYSQRDGRGRDKKRVLWRVLHRPLKSARATWPLLKWLLAIVVTAVVAALVGKLL
jgi:hypothetical protein